MGIKNKQDIRKTHITHAQSCVLDLALQKITKVPTNYHKYCLCTRMSGNRSKYKKYTIPQIQNNIQFHNNKFSSFVVPQALALLLYS